MAQQTTNKNRVIADAKAYANNIQSTMIEEARIQEHEFHNSIIDEAQQYNNMLIAEQQIEMENIRNIQLSL